MKIFFFNVKLGLSGLTSKARVQKGRNCVDMLTGNPAFTFPVGFLASLTSACTALEQADEEVLFHGGKVNYQAKRNAERTLDDLIRELAGYVTAQAGGDEAKILSAGFDVRRQGKPVEALGTPQNLRPLLTSFSGQVRLRWELVEDATNYQVFSNTVGPDAADKWELVAFTSATRYTVEALDSAKFYWFRVCAIGRKGLQSPMSQIVKALAA